MTSTQISPHSTTSKQISKEPLISISERINDLLDCMTIEEKIGQMTLVEKNSIDPETVRRLSIGAVLSGGSGYPPDNSPAGWLAMVNGYQEAAMQTRLGIPLLYGVDAVHGHNNLAGAVIFPHNIGLGATRDVDLVRRIGRATAIETIATGIKWNYAPTIAIPQDFRWGRTYEGFSEDPALVGRFGAAYIQGLQGNDLAAPTSVLSTPKHFVGDGGTSWGSSTRIFPPNPDVGILEPKPFILDQGDTDLDEATLRVVHLSPYLPALSAGAEVVMASFNSWNGQELHSHHYLLTEVLKGELGFSGFIVTDWGGIDKVSTDSYQGTVDCINAGIDMSMVPTDYPLFIANVRQAVKKGHITLSRIDDAVRRILTVKMKAGLFEHPIADDRFISHVGAPAHRELAREAAAKSMVLLKNEDGLLPLSKSIDRLFVAGDWGDDLGLQCGGWTIEWQGKRGRHTAGTTILEAIQATVSSGTLINYDPEGYFLDADGESEDDTTADLGLLFLGEEPYAEGFGDLDDLYLPETQVALLERMRRRCRKLAVVLVTGRPLIITEQLPVMDALVVAWLPGSEGQGVADVLFGDVPFTGKLPFTWPRDMAQVPIRNAQGASPLFPFGFGYS